MSDRNASWGELRSIVHSGGDIADLTRVLERWPGDPGEDEALRDYLAPHKSLWMLPRGELPYPPLLERWLRGDLRMLLELSAPEHDWKMLGVCEALDIGASWEPSDIDNLGFYWSYAPIYQFADGYQWTLRRAREIEVSSEPRFEPEGPYIPNIIKQITRHLDTYGPPEAPLDLLEIDIDCAGITLADGWEEIPHCSFTATMLETRAWMQGQKMTPRRWVSMFELWWQLAQRSLDSERGPAFCDEESNIEKEVPFLTESWSIYRNIRAAIVLPTRPTGGQG